MAGNKMGSKTRSLGLSSLVVTTLDKGAFTELTSNGWTVPDNPTTEKLLAASRSIQLDSIVPSSTLTRAVELSLTDSFPKAKIRGNLPIHTSVVKKQSSSGWRKKWS